MVYINSISKSPDTKRFWSAVIAVTVTHLCQTFGSLPDFRPFFLVAFGLPPKVWWQDVTRRLWMSCSDQLQNPLWQVCAGSINQQFESVWCFVMLYRFVFCFACVVLRFYRILPFGFKGKKLDEHPTSWSYDSSIFHHPCVSYILKMIENDRRWDQKHFQALWRSKAPKETPWPAAARPVQLLSLPELQHFAPESWHVALALCWPGLDVFQERWCRTLQDIETKKENLFDVWLHLLSALTAFSAWAALLNPGGTGCH